MKRRAKIILAVIGVFALVILSRPALEFIGGKPPSPGQGRRDHLGVERVKLINPDMVLKLVAPPQGSTVLDLGAGYGLFTFPLAQSVGASGRIFATDMDPMTITFLDKESRKRSLGNIVPVLVQAEGVDRFYVQQTFDVVLASDVVVLIDAPDKFFDALRPSLKSGSGRLWIVDMLLDPDLQLAEFYNPAELLDLLRADSSKGGVLTGRLRPDVRRELLASGAADASPALLAAVIADLNSMLEDPSLWKALKDGGYSLNPREAGLRSHLDALLSKEPTTAPDGKSSLDSRWLRRFLNRILLTDLLGSETWRKATKITDLTAGQFQKLHDSPVHPTQHGSPHILAGAGFELVQAYTSNPYCRILEMKRSR